MPLRRLIWLAVPLLGLVELALHHGFATRAPRAEEWSGLRLELERIARPGDLVVVAPVWAEPLARQALGERWMPLADVARSDVATTAHALEVSLVGARSEELDRFREVSRREHGPFLLRRLENPAPRPALYRFVDHVAPDALRVSEVRGSAESACPYTDSARPSAGGLGGHVAYPRARFRCAGGEPFFVGVTVMDDQRYRPRRCIFAHPVADGVLRLEFAGVPLGRVLTGTTGTTYLIQRDGAGTDVELRAFAGDRELGRAVQRDVDGFQPFEFRLPPDRPERADVRFEIRTADAHAREFCFTAETR